LSSSGPNSFHPEGSFHPLPVRIPPMNKIQYKHYLSICVYSVE
jgi:hypothetical protein